MTQPIWDLLQLLALLASVYLANYYRLRWRQACVAGAAALKGWKEALDANDASRANEQKAINGWNEALGRERRLLEILSTTSESIGQTSAGRDEPNG